MCIPANARIRSYMIKFKTAAVLNVKLGLLKVKLLLATDDKLYISS